MNRFFGAICALGLLAVAFTAAPAGAHQGNSNFRSEITAVKPAAVADGLVVEMKNFDDHVEMVNRTGKVVIVRGYDGEPYVRLSPSGLVEVNLNSPAYYLNEDRFADVQVPARADADARPDWQAADESGTYNWHDHRTHYMGKGTPPQVIDESVETKVFDYSVPLTVDGRKAAAHGTLTWVGDQGGASVLPFILLALLIVAGAVAVPLIRRRREVSGDGDGPTDGDGPAAGDRSAGGDDSADGRATGDGVRDDSGADPGGGQTEAW